MTPAPAATHAITEPEQARLNALQAVTAPELGLQRHYPLADVLEEHPIFSPGHGLVVQMSMLAPLQDTAAVTGWLERFPRARRQKVGGWTLGHLLPGNHPGAILSALLPGFLLGCKQVVRPSRRLRDYTAQWLQVVNAQFATLQSPTLPAELCSWDHQAPDAAARLAEFLQSCDVVTVQGSDLTAASIQSAWAALPEKKRPHLIAFTGRLSIAAVDCVAAAAVINSASDTAMFLAMGEQRGCLCPHGVMLVGPEPARAAWLKKLATALSELDTLDTPAAAISPEEPLAVAYQHQVYRELARQRVADYAVRELGTGGKLGRLWEVPLTEPPLALTGRSFSVWQADTPQQAAQSIAAWQIPMQAIGCAPGPAASAAFEKTFARPFAQLDAWVTSLEQLHSPPVDWPQDGKNLLARLIALAG